ncbi:MAG TPA: LysM domain-containing protein [Mariprofundaceae bacterium]|nr:LysM domain-containing protein [Mariprofundaceae bacterium]
MIAKGSRYENCRSFASEDGTTGGFAGIRPRPIGPASAVLEYTVKEGDRLDSLALHFYDDAQRWWRILDANPGIVFGADLLLAGYVGEVILIPRSVEPGGSA